MSEESNSASNGSVGFVGLLTLLFIGLKLTGFIAWSWWWVLSPLWIAGAVLGVLFAVVLALAFIGSSKR